MSAAWAQGDKCPLWNAEMNSQKGERKAFIGIAKAPNKGVFSSSTAGWGWKRGVGGTVSRGRLLATQTLDCETSVDGPTEQRPLFLLSGPGPKAMAA